MGEFESEWEDVLSGVPQGSVLKPLLFVVFINDITNKIDSISKLFADDTKLLKAIKDNTDSVKLQQDTDSLVEWSIKFNHHKCKVMMIGNSQPNIKFTMDGQKLLNTSMEKDLGFLFQMIWNGITM